MKLTRMIAIAVIAASGALGIAQAQSLRQSGEPAEFPPSTYKGRQYVDSKGCVYIRAGIDGNVTWVPRVSRSRQQVCGLPPTNVGTRAAQVARQPAPKPAAQPAATAPRAAAGAAAATASTVRRSTPAAAVATRPRVETQPVRRAAPALVRPVAQPTPAVRSVTAATTTATAARTSPQVATKQRRAATTRSGCPGMSALSAQYMGSSRYGVRCGPQAESPHGAVGRVVAAPSALAPAAAAPQVYVPRSYATTGGTYSPTQPRRYGQATRIAPHHVYAKQQAANVGTLRIPDGYKRVWMDDRLNPRRAQQTFQGKDQMDLIWTRTVPRKLIVRRTGRVVTQDYPELVYPYTSYEQMYQAQAQAPSRGYGMKTFVSSRGVAPEASTARKAQSPVKSTTAATQRASHSYVQAGVYATRAQAASAAQRLARTGVTTRLGTLTKGGKSYSLVLAGPFRTQSQLDSALATARAAGFGNARLRK